MGFLLFGLFAREMQDSLWKVEGAMDGAAPLPGLALFLGVLLTLLRPTLALPRAPRLPRLDTESAS